jgi:hypothetical protein
VQHAKQPTRRRPRLLHNIALGALPNIGGREHAQVIVSGPVVSSVPLRTPGPWSTRLRTPYSASRAPCGSAPADMRRYGDPEDERGEPPAAGAQPLPTAPPPARRSRPTPLTIGDAGAGAPPAIERRLGATSVHADGPPGLDRPVAAAEDDTMLLASPAPAAWGGGALVRPGAGPPPSLLHRGPGLALPSPAPACTPSLAGVHRRFRW